MTERVDHLRDIYSRLGGTEAFTEHQEQARGSVRSDDAIDRDLRTLVVDLRKRGDVRTTLPDDALVRIVRGVHAGLSDRDLASALDVSPETVFRARMSLHLFTNADVVPAFGCIAAGLRAGAPSGEVAVACGVSRAAVDRTARLLVAREAARRVNYYYTTEFAELLAADTANVELDRQVWDDRQALVDAHDD